MSLFKRGNVYWAIWSSSGLRHQKSTGTGNRKQAERIEQQFKDEENAKKHGLPEANPDMTLASLVARFLSEGNPKAHHRSLLKNLLPFFGEMATGQISKGLVSTYRQLRQSHDQVTPATTNRDVSVLRRILNWGVEQNLLLINPLTRVKMERERKTKRPVLTVFRERALLEAAAEHLRLLIIAALDTGMRRGELASQLWQDVDLPRGLLFVTRSKTPEGDAREIPLTARLKAALTRIAKAEGLVFTFKGEHLQSVKHSWATAIRRSGIRPLRFHDLRHTFNTRLMEAGVQMEVRMALMGHSSGQGVNGIYTHVELPTKRRAIAALERWVAEQDKNETEKPKEDTSATSKTEDDRNAAGQA